MLNKIDLPAADPEKYAAEIARLIGGDPDDVLRVSGKTGMGVDALLDRVVRTVPAPTGDVDGPARAMIFDSVYDAYRGVVTYVRMVDGTLRPREQVGHDVDRLEARGARDRRLEPRADPRRRDSASARSATSSRA